MIDDLAWILLVRMLAEAIFEENVKGGALMEAVRILTGWGVIYIQDKDIADQDRLPMTHVTWVPNDHKPTRYVHLPNRVWEQLSAYFAHSEELAKKHIVEDKLEPVMHFVASERS